MITIWWIFKQWLIPTGSQSISISSNHLLLLIHQLPPPLPLLAKCSLYLSWVPPKRGERGKTLQPWSNSQIWPLPQKIWLHLTRAEWQKRGENNRKGTHIWVIFLCYLGIQYTHPVGITHTWKTSQKAKYQWHLQMDNQYMELYGSGIYIDHVDIAERGSQNNWRLSWFIPRPKLTWTFSWNINFQTWVFGSDGVTQESLGWPVLPSSLVSAKVSLGDYNSFLAIDQWPKQGGIICISCCFILHMNDDVEPPPTGGHRPNFSKSVFKSISCHFGTQPAPKLFSC